MDFCRWSYIIFSTMPRVSPSRSDSCRHGGQRTTTPDTVNKGRGHGGRVGGGVREGGMGGRGWGGGGVVTG